jgi:hypothetical protein
MKKGTPKQRKKFARVKSEMRKLEAKAYKLDGCEYNDERLNTRYFAKVKEFEALSQLLR